VNLIEQLSAEVERLSATMGREYYLIAESDLNDPRVVRPREAGGYGIDAQWSDDFHHALFAVLTGDRQGYYADFGSLADLAKSLQEVFVYNGNYSNFRRRHHGRPTVGLPGNRFVGCIQNHDQVGNQATGQRISHLVTLGRAKIAAAIVLTSPFVPLLFQGEEFAASAPFQYFTHYEDTEIGRLVSEGRKREFEGFGWSPDEIPDPQDKSTFERSKLNWTEPEKPVHAEVLQWYKDLIRLRRKSNDLEDGNLSAVHVRFDEHARWLVIERGEVRVACNLGAARVRLEIGNGAKLLLASDPSFLLSEAGIELDPDSVAILLIRQSAE